MAWLATPCSGAMNTNSNATATFFSPAKTSGQNIINVCKEILEVLDAGNDGLLVAKAIAEHMTTFFEESTCKDRTRITLPSDPVGSENLAFYRALGFIFACVLSQGNGVLCHEQQGWSCLPFKKNKNNMGYILLFCAKKSDTQLADKISEDCKTLCFLRTDFDAPKKDFIIPIYFNTDICSTNPGTSVEMGSYENKIRDCNTREKSYLIEPVLEVSTAYDRNKNFIAQMIDNKKFNCQSIQLILGSIPPSWRCGAGEVYFTSLLAFLFRSLGNCVAEHQKNTRLGIADNIIFTDKTEGLIAYIVEAKLNGSRKEEYDHDEALTQAKVKYAEIFNNRLRGSNTYVLIVGLHIRNDVEMDAQMACTRDNFYLTSGEEKIYGKQNNVSTSEFDFNTPAKKQDEHKDNDNDDENQNNPIPFQSFTPVKKK